MKYKVLGGNHAENGKVYPKGSIVESVLPLDKMFANKFQPILGQEPILETSQGTIQPEEEKTKEVTVLPMPEGKLVDHLFDFDPESVGLHVYRNKREFFVYDEDDMAVALNTSPLKRGDVIPFIEKQCEI